MKYSTQVPTPMAVRSKSWVCGRTIVGNAGSNPAEGLDVRLLCLWCVVQVAASATSWSPVQRSPVGCVCDVQTSDRDHLGPIWAVASQAIEVTCMSIYHTYLGDLVGTSTVIAV